MPGGGSQILGGSLMASFFGNTGTSGPKCYQNGALIGCAQIFGLASMGAAFEGSSKAHAAIYDNAQKKYVGLAHYNRSNPSSVFGLPTGWSPIGMNFNSSNGGSWTFEKSFFSSDFINAAAGDLIKNGFGSLGGYLYDLATPLRGQNRAFATVGQVNELSSAYADRAEVFRFTAILPDPVKLKQLIIDRLDQENGRCRGFIDAVRQNLGINKTIETLYDEVLEKGGEAVLGLDIASAGVSRYGKGFLDIGLSPVNDSSDRYTNYVIHELIHRGGVENHRSFAQAAFSTLSEDEKRSNPLPTTVRKGARDMDDTYSGYFSSLQNLFCRPNI